MVTYIYRNFDKTSSDDGAMQSRDSFVCDKRHGMTIALQYLLDSQCDKCGLCEYPRNKMARWIWLLLAGHLSAVTTALCPAVCQCSSNFTADCSSKNLTSASSATSSLPNNLLVLRLENNLLSSVNANDLWPFTSLKRLDLDQNVLRDLPESVFTPLHELQILYLNGNNLTTLPAKLFSTLENLVVLWLHDNEIAYLPSEIFDSQTSLRILSLLNNSLRKLDKQWFKNLGSLEFLALSNNKLISIEDDTFSGLSNLKNLSLHHNQISHIQDRAFSQMPKLEILWLYDNKLIQITDNVFSGATSVRSLSLHNNMLKNISSKAFLSLTNLEQIYLDGNLLTSIDSNLFVSQEKLRMLELQDNKLTSVDIESVQPLISLRAFNLSGNPLVCDCALWDVWLWWSAQYLNPMATCQLPQAKETVSVREQLQNLTCNADEPAEVKSDVPQTQIQVENTCDVRKLAVASLILLIVICAMITGVFVYVKFFIAKRHVQDTLIPLDSETI